ncbi:MAG: hypothetical protein KBT33_04155 [Prevotellaceae bacterium]|nr:hypothetical protein [Candidatus Minthosoma equi]
MKKQYIAPKAEIFNVNSSEIVCASTGFGEDGVHGMHAKDLDYDEDLSNFANDILWNE